MSTIFSQVLYSPLMQSPPTSPSSSILTATIHSPYANQPACASNLQYCGDQVRTLHTKCIHSLAQPSPLLLS